MIQMGVLCRPQTANHKSNWAHGRQRSMRDAFQLLMQAGTRRPVHDTQHDASQATDKDTAVTPAASQQQLASSGKGSKRQRVDNTGSKQYGSCPVCSRTIPLPFLEMHVSTCLDAKQAGGALEQPSCTASDTAQHAASQDTHVAAIPAPTPASQITIDLTQMMTPKPAQEGREATQPAASTHAETAVYALQPATGGQEHAADGSTQAPNAFDTMMKAAAARQQQHVFYLELLDTGQWRYHWWQKGLRDAPDNLPAACWSCQTHVKEGKSAGKAASTQLELRTNVKPTDVSTGLIDWQNQGLTSNQQVPPEGRWRGLPSGLKSALQKCCRLGRAGPAVRLMLHILKNDASEVLRRLPIICCEDSLLHPHLPLITWLMAAQAKGYQLGPVHVNALLQFTYEVALTKVHDYLPPGNMCPAPLDTAGLSASKAQGNPDSSAVSPPRRTLHTMQDVDAALPHHPQGACLAKCLLLRAHFGGMQCDVQMMRGFANYWVARFQGAAAGPPPRPQEHLQAAIQLASHANPMQQHGSLDSLTLPVHSRGASQAQPLCSPKSLQQDNNTGAPEQSPAGQKGAASGPETQLPPPEQLPAVCTAATTVGSSCVWAPERLPAVEAAAAELHGSCQSPPQQAAGTTATVVHAAHTFPSEQLPDGVHQGQAWLHFLHEAQAAVGPLPPSVSVVVSEAEAEELHVHINVDIHGL